MESTEQLTLHTEGENTEGNLEEWLKKAATDPAARPEFYRKLLYGNLIVLTDNAELPKGLIHLDRDITMNLIPLNDGRLPAFTSVVRIFDKGIVKGELQYMEVASKDLFNFTTGDTIVLNPFSDYGKDLLPDEIENLLSGEIFAGGIKKVVLPEETQVLIAQPAVYPTKFIDSLKQFYATEPLVNAAYLGWIQYPDLSKAAHYIIAIDTAGDIDSLDEKTGAIAREHFTAGDLVDFMALGEGGLSTYFNNIAPFYKK